jgi:hypothetical protein
MARNNLEVIPDVNRAHEVAYASGAHGVINEDVRPQAVIDQLDNSPKDIRQVNARHLEAPIITRPVAHYRLATELDVTRHLPVGDSPDALTRMTGRICVFNVDARETPGGTPAQSERWGLFDGDFMTGRDYAQIRAQEASESGVSSVYADMTSGVIVLRQDTGAIHPLQAEKPLYIGDGDYELVSVMTDADPNARDGIVAYEEIIYDRDDKGNIIGHEITGDPVVISRERIVTTLSQMVGKLESVWAEKVPYDPKFYDQFCATFAAQFSPRLNPGGKNQASVDFTKAKGVDLKVKDFIREYVDAYKDDLLGLRVPVRAFHALEEITADEEAYKAKHGKLSGEVSKYNNLRRAAIRREVREAILMPRLINEEIQRKNNYQEVRPGAWSVIHPLRAEMRACDELDMHFALNLPRVIEQMGPGFKEYGPAAMALARQAKQWRESNISLFISPVGLSDPSGFMTGSLHAPMKPQPALIHAPGSCDPSGAPQGYYPLHDMAKSAYDREEPLKMPGVVGVFDYKGPDMDAADRYLVLDLMEAPARVLRWVERIGHLNKATVDQRPLYLSEILAVDPEPKQRFLALARAALKNGVPTLEFNGPINDHILNAPSEAAGASLFLMRTPSGVATREGRVVDGLTAFRASQGEEATKSLSRKDRQGLAQETGVAFARPESARSQIIASIALIGGGVEIAVGKANRSVTAAVMPNTRRYARARR